MVVTYTTWYKCLFCTRVYPLAPQLIEHRKKFHLEQFREYRLAKKLKKNSIEAREQNDNHSLHSNGTDTDLDSTNDNLSVSQLSTSSSIADISSLINSDSATEIIEPADNSEAKDTKKVKFDLRNVKQEHCFTKTWNCDKCTKAFRNKWGLTMHKEVHSRNRYVVKRHVPIKRERVIRLS